VEEKGRGKGVDRKTIERGEVEGRGCEVLTVLNCNMFVWIGRWKDMDSRIRSRDFPNWNGRAGVQKSQVRAGHFLNWNRCSQNRRPDACSKE
jgi:hypothetical protein